MPARRRLAARSRRISHRTARRAIGAGAAGLTAALAAAPLAHADPTPTTTTVSGTATPTAGNSSSTATAGDGTSTSPAANGTTTSTPAAPGSKSAGSRTPHLGPQAKNAAQPAARATTKHALAADYGQQKYRVGVRLKDGAYAPPGTTTVGTTLHVVETGPNAPQPSMFDCVTVATSSGPGGSASSDPHDPTFCPGFSPLPGVFTGSYLAQSGDTITVTQTTVNPNLQLDPSPVVLSPCTVPDGAPPGAVCTADGGGVGDGEKSTDLVFDDNGLAPVANPDSASTKHDKSVDVDVSANDDSKGAPITGLSVGSAPGHGSATVLSGSSDPVGATPASAPSTPAPTTSTTTTTAPPPIGGLARRAGAQRELRAAAAAPVVGSTIRYTPNAGFSGTDTFTYRLSTANGNATARVTVRVAAATGSSSASSSASSSSTSPTSTNSPAAPTSATSSGSHNDDNLADTGSDTRTLGEVGLGLLVVGGAATVAGRRRRAAARHARHG